MNELITFLCICMLSVFRGVWFFLTPQIVALQPPLSVGFPRQEYWSGLPFPPPGDLPDPGIKPTSLMSPTVAGGFFTTSLTWEAPFLQMAKARLWVHWNHSFDMHLSSLETKSYAFPSGTPSRYNFMSSDSGWGLGSRQFCLQLEFPQGSLSEWL